MQFQSDDDPVKRSSTERYSSQFFDNMVLLAALYSVTVTTAMFIMPVIHHFMRYHHFDVERFLLTTKKHVMIDIICIMHAIYLGLGLAIDSDLPIQFA